MTNISYKSANNEQSNVIYTQEFSHNSLFHFLANGSKVPKPVSSASVYQSAQAKLNGALV